MPTNRQIYTSPVIASQVLPSDPQALPVVLQGASPKQTFSSPVLPPVIPPQIMPAREVISASFDTLQKRILDGFSFGISGALQIGDYTNGVSGDIKISPNGIVARNINGVTTFALDGKTGSATFLGTIQAGSFVAGDSSVVVEGSSLGGSIVIYSAGIPFAVMGVVA